MKNMKKILKLFPILLILSIVVWACREDNPEYKGSPYLHFNNGTSKSEIIFKGADHKDIKITYGSIKAVTGANQVKLVLDTQKSTAVEGVDFQILKNPDDLAAGEVSGEFTVRLLEAGATQAPKKAVFKLQSTTIENAVFDQEYTLTISLTCPVAGFYGSFTNTDAWWNNPGGTFDIVASSVPNQMLVKDFWDLGKDLVFNYNPETFVVTLPDQNTGYLYSANNYIWAKQATDATKISTFNPCTRVLTLNVNYYVPNVGGWGNQVEKFTGK